MSRRAFTLIELLVVITIIVVLLALLTPALDKAIYQAELTVCAANQHGVAAGSLVYASEYQRRYPHRPGHISAPGNQPARVKNTDTRLPFDDRPIFQNHIALKALVCPMTGEIDLGSGVNDDDTQIFGTYNLWFGFRFNRVGTHQGMLKLGNRFSWGGSNYTPTKRSSNVLLTDTDKVDEGNGFATTTHPDLEGRMVNAAFQNEPGGLGGVQVKLTASEWALGNSFQRPVVDSNYAYDDGSVQTLREVKYDDDRLFKVPNWADAQGINSVYTQVPPTQ